MYIDADLKNVIWDDDIVGIFDLENASVKIPTRNFLRRAEKRKQIINKDIGVIPISFIVSAADKRDRKIYFSGIKSTNFIRKQSYKNYEQITSNK